MAIPPMSDCGIRERVQVVPMGMPPDLEEH